MSYNPYYTPQTWSDGNASYPLSAARMSNIEARLEQNSYNSQVGTVAFDDPYFTGANDDATFASILSYAAAQSVPPQILFAARTYTFANSYAVYDGFAIKGVGARGNSELFSQKGCTKTVIHATVNGTFLDCSAGGGYNSGYVMDLSIRNIMFNGSTNTQWLGGTGGALHASEIREVGVNGFKSALGTQANALGLTTCVISDMDINNSYTGAVTIAGSDNILFEGHCNIDSPTSALSQYSATGQYHIWCDYLEKSYIGPVYITCQGGWMGLRVSGPPNPATDGGNNNNGGPVWVRGAKIEGRNAGEPCDGANVWVDGGILDLADSWVSYGMASPSGLGHSTTDAGMIMHMGGTLIVDKVTYDTATGVSGTVPFVYRGGSAEDTIVTNIMRGSKGGSWTNPSRPQIHAAAGSFLITDATTATV